MCNKRWSFNIPVSEEETELQINEILRLAHNYCERNETDVARILFNRASGSCRGMLENAKFLLALPATDPQTQKAEQHLLYVKGNGTPEEAAEACLILSNMYSRKYEARSLGYLLRAKRLGAKLDNTLIQSLRKRFSGLSINTIEKDTKGAYIAGTECALVPGYSKWALRFLEIATADPGPIAGLAAQKIADLLEDISPGDRTTISHYRALSTAKGNPECLSRTKS